MSCELDFIMKFTVTELLVAPSASYPTISHDAFNSKGTLNADSTPSISDTAPFVLPLVGGQATIDLTALPGTQGSKDATGLLVKGFKIQNPSSNGNPLVVRPGAIDPYGLLGEDFKITLQPGDEIECYLPDTAPSVASDCKTLDLDDDGAGGNESHNFIFVFGEVPGTGTGT
jgi:hypothetical protein